MIEKTRAPRNKTIILTEGDRLKYGQRFKQLDAPVSVAAVLDSTICQDTFDVLGFLPSQAFDLVFADPPYNLTKVFNRTVFKATDLDAYEGWLDSWLREMPRLLKPDGSIYVCGDWRCSAAIHRVLSRYFVVRSRITWEREKGRGAKANWKNNCEDIWFATVSDTFFFDVDAVKLKRRVIAPYTDQEGSPKDWQETDEGRYRVTHPANIWTDLTVPFWSMPENTDHPTQKPEKLLAKVILASSREGDTVFDPFLGSGTTSVVAKKLGRHYVGAEIDPDYCCLAEKRLDLAEKSPGIQGYTDGVFWERNSLAGRRSRPKSKNSVEDQAFLFDALKVAD